MSIKIKLTIDKQIEHMRNQGITFQHVSEEDAAIFIGNHTYYFKIKAFSKNFEKYHSGSLLGEYIGLDFGHLKELSTMDFHLRRFILDTALNIEHSMKVILNTNISSNKSEDGYWIVEQFLSSHSYVSRNITGKLASNSPYTSDLISKYQANLASWNLCEMLSFGEFISFFRYYFEVYPTNAPDYIGLLHPVKCLRNAAAHNNCLINNLSKSLSNEHGIRSMRRFNPSIYLNTKVSQISTISRRMRTSRMKIPIIHDFIAILFLFDFTVKSEPIRIKTYESLNHLMLRLHKRIELFQSNNRITSALSFLEKVVEYFLKTGYTLNDDQKL